MNKEDDGFGLESEGNGSLWPVAIVVIVITLSVTACCLSLIWTRQV